MCQIRVGLRILVHWLVLCVKQFGDVLGVDPRAFLPV